MNDPMARLVGALERHGFDPRAAGADRWVSRCPSHQGRRRNLSISRGDDGRVLVYCHHADKAGRGCEAESVAHAVGLSLAELFPPGEHGRARSAPPASQHPPGPGPRAAVAGLSRRLGEPTGEWTYCDDLGQPVLMVYRFDGPDGKEYRPAHPAPGPGGHWVAGDPPGLLPLYRLPELAEAGRVFVTEGEKAADSARGLGLTATTSCHGAGSARKSDWSPLAGKNVVLLPDHDSAGAGYASAVIGLLAALDPRPTLMTLTLERLWRTDRPLPEGGDIVEWLTDGVPDSWTNDQCREEIERLAAEAPPVDLGAVAAEHGALITCLADVRPVELEWLWPGRLPLRSLVTIAGDPGLGKSFLSIDITARKTRGWPWPDQPDVPTERGSVILFSAEDDLATTVVTRLDAAGADRSRVFTMEISAGNGRRQFTLADITALDQTVKVAKEVRLVIIDPVAAFMGRTDDHRNSEVRALLAPLADLAERYNLTVILITHLNKNGAGRSLARVMGSVAYTAAARSAWAVVKDRLDSTRRLFLPIKANLGPEPSGLAFTIDRQTMRVVWEPDPVHLHADEALAEPQGEQDEARDELKRARAFLREFLGDRPTRAVDIFKRAEELQLSERTIRRAKGAARIDSFKSDDGWMWQLPPGDPEAKPPAPPCPDDAGAGP